VEARPAAARVVLGVRFKQRAATGHAAVLARLLVVPVFAGERRLGGRAAADRVLLVGQLFPPFSIGSIAGWFCHGLFHGPNDARHGIALLLHQGYGMLAAAFGPTGKHRVRPALRLLPLPLCIAVSLTAFADDERPGMWRLCPLEDAVPVFPDAPPPVGTPAERDQHPTDIEGDELSGIYDQVMSYDGNVTLRRGDQFLSADNLTIDAEAGTYSAQGSIRYQDSGMRLVGERLQGNQDLDTHSIEGVRYQLIDQRGSGGAARAELEGEQGALYGSTYSTCPPGQRLWELRSRQIDIDMEEGFGTARGATLHLGSMPVLYVPWFKFPTDDRRKTGLLYPAIGYNSRNGFDWAQPNYLNLAPNYDMTLEPRMMTRRGFLLGNEFR